MIFAFAVRRPALASFAHYGVSIFEVHSTVINRRNYHLPFAIREAVFSIPDNANKPIVE
jgi:hypothetical protein